MMFQRLFPSTFHINILKAVVLEESTLSSRESRASTESTGWSVTSIVRVASSLCASSGESTSGLSATESRCVSDSRVTSAGGLGSSGSVGLVVLVARCVSDARWLSGGVRGEAVELAGCEITGVATGDGGFGVFSAGIFVVEGGDPGEEVTESRSRWCG